MPREWKRKPSIEDTAPFDELRDQTITAVTEANNPPVFFLRGGEVVEIKHNERGVPSAKIVEPTRMRDRMGEIADWFKFDRKGEPYTVRPPMDIASTLLVTPGLHPPPVDAIVEHPVIGRDGRLRTRRGYDRESATYFSPTVPLSGLDTDAHPRLAFSWLSEMLEDFEFASPADRTNVLALMLTPILRPLIDGPVPLAAIRAANAGNGKSLPGEGVVRHAERLRPTDGLADRARRRRSRQAADVDPDRW